MVRPLAFVTLGLLALLLPAPAEAFQPTDLVYTGIEPLRIHRTDPAVQARLQAQPAWQRFLATEGAGWTARFDQGTGTPHRMLGPGLDLGPTTSAAEVEAGLSAFLQRHATLFGLRPGQLGPARAHFVPRLDTWYVDLDVHVRGAPIWRGGITARIKHGRLVMLGVDTYPDVPVVNRERINAQAAIFEAIARGEAPLADHTEVDAELVALPQEVGGALQLRLAWLVRSRTEQPPGLWNAFVDADTGELFHLYNDVRFFNVQGEHDLRTVNGDLWVSPLQRARVSGDGWHVFTDLYGDFEPAGEGPYELTLHGERVRVTNRGGPNAAVTFEGPELLLTDEDASMAEISSFVFLNEVVDWGERVAPEVSFVQATVQSNVNLEASCNAYFDGTVNFFRSGSGCNNTARIADVNYHEWGHGFHWFSILTGAFDGSLSEGAADTIAFLHTRDPVIAPHFMVTGAGIREVATVRRYPEDFRDDDNFVHSNGLIFGGAMWNLWHALMDVHGEEAGTEALEHIFSALLKGGPDIPASYYEAVVADATDGDTSDTPNLCLIVDVFGMHGLGPAAHGEPLRLVHEPPLHHPADTPVALDASLLNLVPACFPHQVSSGRVVWRVDGGDWQEIPLDLEGDDAWGSLPPQPAGAIIEYWVEIDDAEGATLAAPEGRHINPFSLYVGEVLELYCEDFEADNGGYHSELVAGTNVLGANDWQWGIPMGKAGDPTEAFAGQYVWGNDLGNGSYDGAYQDDKHNRLTSPLIEVGHHDGAFLHYMRWLTVEDGKHDQTRILANGEVIWSNWASDSGQEHHIDTQWAPHVVPLPGQGTTLELSWELISNASVAMGGWNIDQVCVYAPDTPDNRLGISDFVAEPTDDGIALSWTHPRFEPLAEVRVVRTRDAWPTGPHDGEVVFEDRSPSLGAAASFTDQPRGKGWHYAVYASDGTDWLSWTRPGLNADGLEARGGCGCAVGGGGTLPAGALVLLALGALRRRG